VKASHDDLVELFGRIESFIKRLGVYSQLSLTTEMLEVLVKIVAEVLSVLSIATKEVKRKRTSELFSRDIAHTRPLICDQKYISGNYWEGQISRMRSKGYIF